MRSLAMLAVFTERANAQQGEWYRRCMNWAGCTHLAGTPESQCCPTVDGVWLDCCRQNEVAGEDHHEQARAKFLQAVQRQRNGDVPAQSKQNVGWEEDPQHEWRRRCMNWGGCSPLGLSGHCCPTDDGIMLDCCRQNDLAGQDHYEQAWAEFQAAQGQRNGDVPAAFKRNVDFINEQNAKDLGYKLSWTGPFAAMTSEEFKTMLGARLSMPEHDMTDLGPHVSTGATASSIDWTERGAVTPVKSQGGCGSCWAFAATGTLESAWQIASGNLVTLSEQQQLDCSGDKDPCSGGSSPSVIAYAQSAAICTEASYRYQGVGPLPCAASSCDAGLPQGGITGHKSVNGEDEMANALNQQPVYIYLNASGTPWQFYSSGVMSADDCDPSINHAVMGVGYGEDFWKFKNSWGQGWGEQGYGRIVRGVNACGIGKSSIGYPVAASPSPSPSDASCSAHSACSSLLGNCCPTDDGVTLDCCGSTTPTPSPPNGDAACSAHAACAELDGNCCPTDDGVRLGCCSTTSFVEQAFVAMV